MTETLLYAVGMDERGNAFVIAMQHHILYVRSALSKVTTQRLKRYITNYHWHKVVRMTEIT